MTNTPKSINPDFIRLLVDDLQPVKMRSPLRSLWTWGIPCLAVSLLFARFLGFRLDLSAWLSELLTVSSEAFLLSLFLICSWATFHSGIPGRKPLRLLPGALYLIWALILVPWVTLTFYEPAGVPVQVGLDLHGIGCSLTVVGLSIVPLLSLLLLLNFRYAAIAPRYTGRFAGMAAGILGAWTIAWHCPQNESVHILVWHLGPVFLLSWLTSRIAQRVLKF